MAVKIRAFIFDDDDIIRTMLQRVFARRGYEVYAFADPSDCSLFLRNPCPCSTADLCGDIILSDVNMPCVSGIEFVENQIKWGCRLKHWALMTGALDPSTEALAQRLHCRLFIKPFTLTELHRWLEECERDIQENRTLNDWFKQRPAQVEMCH